MGPFWRGNMVGKEWRYRSGEREARATVSYRSGETGGVKYERVRKGGREGEGEVDKSEPCASGAAQSPRLQS